MTNLSGGCRRRMFILASAVRAAEVVETIEPNDVLRFDVEAAERAIVTQAHRCNASFSAPSHEQILEVIHG